MAKKLMDKNFVEKLRKETPTNIEKLINTIKPEEENKKEFKKGKYSIVAVTSCATGIAHTYMAADAIEKGALAKGFNIKVEKRGAMGAENALTKEDIENADLCIIASEVNIDSSIFAGKKLYVSKASEAIKLGDKYVSKAVNQGMINKEQKNVSKSNVQSKGDMSRSKFSILQEHLLYGVS
jgi:fructose-specific phosphotransferase system IIB component